MKFLVTIAALCLCLVSYVSGQQYFLRQYPSPLSRFAYDVQSLGVQPSFPKVRDQRENRGPVVFPPPPPAEPGVVEETSGVVPGASGFGFVPPQTSTTVEPTYFSASFESPETSYSTFNFFSRPYFARYTYF